MSGWDRIARAAADRGGVEAPRGLRPDLGIGAHRPHEVDGQCPQGRRAVALARDGVEAEPAVRRPDERPHRLVERILLVRRRDPLGQGEGVADGGPGGGLGLVAETSGQDQELLERGEAGEGGGPGVGQQVGPLQRCELGQVLGECRPVRGLVADPEDAPAAGVHHGEALCGLGDRLGLGVEDQVAHRRARLPIGRAAPAPRPGRATPFRWTMSRPEARARARRAAG